jgi:hypothetical protein
MEFKYLAQLTGKAKYFHNSDKVMDFMQQEQGKTLVPGMVRTENGELVEKLIDEDTGLWTTHWYLEDGKMFGSKLTKWLSLKSVLTIYRTYLRGRNGGLRVRVSAEAVSHVRQDGGTTSQNV